MAVYDEIIAKKLREMGRGHENTQSDTPPTQEDEIANI